MAELRSRVMAGSEAFSATEITQLMFMLRATVAVNQDTHLQHAVGLIDTRTFEMTLGALRAHLVWPVFRAIWAMIRVEFPEKTMAFVDKVMAETPIARSRDLPERLRALLAASAIAS